MQVVYPFSWARIIHPAPLVLTVSLPFLQKGAFGGMSLVKVYARIALETLVALASILSGVLCCAFIGILRVTSLGASSFEHFVLVGSGWVVQQAVICGR